MVSCGKRMAKITWWIVPCVGVATLVWACLPTWFQWTGTGNEHLSAVAFADLNRDGKADIVLGGGGGGVSPGIVKVMDGANPTHVLFTFHGDQAGDYFGDTVTTGDVTGDGVPDVLVGAYGWTNKAGQANTGKVEVYDGVTGKLVYTLEGEKSPDNFGSCLDASADITGDGRNDILVGACFADPVTTGYVKLFDGATGRELYKWTGAETWDEMGRACAFGDVNGDGTADIVLGAGSSVKTDWGGYVWVYDGKAFTRRLYAFNSGASQTKPEPNFGHRLAVADLNGDGKAEIIVGAYRGKIVRSRREQPATGYVRVFDGATGALLYQLNGTTDGGQFGIAIATGDVNGDGRLEVIVGERWASPEAVHVYDGKTGAELCVYTNPGPAAWFGQTVGAGDVDGNGKANVAAGAYQGATNSASHGGYVTVFANQ